MKKLLICVFIITVSYSVYSQSYLKNRYELVYSIGAANFLGELGGANKIGSTTGIRDMEFFASRPVIGIGYRYKLTREAAAKVSLYYGHVYGNDKLTKELARNNRNLNFRSPIIEFSGQYEYLFITSKKPGHRYNLKGITGWKNKGFEAYLFGGLGIFYFNPKGKYNGSWHALKPLSTEGQGLLESRRRYSLVQVCVPVGIGIRQLINEKWYVGLECSFRKTFTDYIDDVSTTYIDPNFLLDNNKGVIAQELANPTKNITSPSMTAPGQQRGDPRNKDSYLYAVITVYYKLPKGLSKSKF